MGNSEHLLSKMNAQYQKFSKGQKKLAAYIQENYDKAAFLTAAKLGETVGVSESTVVRFAIYLGYKGYPEFQNLLSKMNAQYQKFSKGQKKLAAYIQENYDKAAFLTAAKLGETVGVSESTVVRFAIYLGYKGYPEFQKALEELVRTKLNSIQRMEVTYGKVPQSEILDTVLHSDIDKIKMTLDAVDHEAFELAVETILKALDAVDHEAFELAVETILKAKNIYIVGIRSCAPLAGFLAFYLNLIFDSVRLLNTNSASELFEQMIRIGEEDVIIGISFPRYSMRTLKALEFANNRNAKVITLTDSIHSPMNLYSSCNQCALIKYQQCQ